MWWMLAAGCGGGDDGGGGEVGPGAFDEAFETSADFFTLMAGPTDEGSVHGEMQIWYSTNLRELVESGDAFVAPEGSVAIKRQGPEANPVHNVMIKLAEGESAATDDWTFEQRDADFTVTLEGPVELCWGCLAGFPDQDALGGTSVR